MLLFDTIHNYDFFLRIFLLSWVVSTCTLYKNMTYEIWVVYWRHNGEKIYVKRRWICVHSSCTLIFEFQFSFTFNILFDSNLIFDDILSRCLRLIPICAYVILLVECITIIQKWLLLFELISYIPEERVENDIIEACELHNTKLFKPYPQIKGIWKRIRFEWI